MGSFILLDSRTLTGRWGLRKANILVQSTAANLNETLLLGGTSGNLFMIKHLPLVAFIFIGTLVATALPAGNASNLSLLQTLRSGHPRLLVLDKELASVKELIKNDPTAKLLYQQLQSQAEKILHDSPLAYKIDGNQNDLLGVSRRIEGRVWLLAGLYRLNGDRRLAARARDEMLAAARFSDWNPKHFLDTGEMTAALGVGYDWLFDYLSPQERLTIRQAIVTKGLDPGIAGLSVGGELLQKHNNWVQVCDGGLTIGALAIADEEKNKAADIIGLARAPMAKIMELFAPDGGFEEGPVYWSYATIYNACYLAALESALGTDFGLSQAAGFANTGNYRMQTIGPLGKSANFGDATEVEEILTAPQMFWLARKFNRPEYALHECEVASLPALNALHQMPSRFLIMELLWYQPGISSLKNAGMPAGAKFDRIAAAFFRSAWGDTNAVYVGFKGGSSRSSHGHLDLGTFVLDAFGQRWAVDLGKDITSYALPQGWHRWDLYHLRTEGHNTLTMDNQNEDLNALAPLTAFSDDKNRSFAIADLKAAYPKNLATWQRGVMLHNQRQVLVQDELQPKKATDIVWNFHTYAAIAVAGNGAEATLSQGASRLVARILSPANAKFEVLAVNLTAPQHPCPGAHNLIIRLPHVGNPTTISVLFLSPDDKTPPPSLTPLIQWKP